MTWESFYLGCFLVGFLLSLVSFLAQTGHFHGTHVHAHAHGHGGAFLAKFNFSSATAFLAWFGGAGYLLERHTSLWSFAAFGLAALIGAAGACLVLWSLAKLVARDRTLDPADYEMIGVLGRVSSTVRIGGTGEMIFARDGGRRSAAVRSEDGVEIGRGAEVVVTRYEKGIAYVKKWDELTS
jgi:membrane protein implicated in regulation of membrane protease activity